MKAVRTLPGSGGFWAACDTPEGKTLICFDVTRRKALRKLHGMERVWRETRKEVKQ
jgi:hypothetical protein